MDTDVLIVGAGPTGLMLANQLGRRGIRVEIVDRSSGPALQSRALGVQARTLEIYERLGIVEKALEFGKRAVGGDMWVRRRKVARIPLGDIGQGLSPYPFMLILGQDDNERLLGDLLRRWNIAVRWNTELVDLRQEPDRVTARLKQPDGTLREISAAWVAGCDGGRSTVRAQCGIEFQGAPYEHVFFVADTIMTGPMVPDELNVYLWKGGFHLFFPIRGDDHWRVVGIVPSSMRGREDLTLDELMPAIREEAGSELAYQKCYWFSTYRIHHRRAERFRDRRCFLLGDAAHVHSPVGAQGMNTGLQDAYNLAWKLGLVIAGDAGEGLLDTYAEERIPFARRLLSTTDRAFALIVSEGGLSGYFRIWILPRLLATGMRFERFRKLAFRTISQTNIRYRASSLSETLAELPGSAPRAGARIPWLRLRFSANGPREDLYRKLDDTRFALLLIGQMAPPEGVPGLAERLSILPIPSDPENDRELARAGIPHPAFFLVRPDGHIGLAGARWDAAAVKRYLSKRLMLSLDGR
jgi:2-polyprenyl-6-methoxyphenol hydroxylase-like FAD-dependent oxidoreductase